jgi:hypothetical protein
LITRIIFGVYESLSTPLRIFSSLLDPNVFLKSVFSNSICLSSSLNFKDQISHLCKTGKITVLCILIFVQSDCKQERGLRTVSWKAFPEFVNSFTHKFVRVKPLNHKANFKNTRCTFFLFFVVTNVSFAGGCDLRPCCTARGVPTPSVRDKLNPPRGRDSQVARGAA